MAALYDQKLEHYNVVIAEGAAQVEDTGQVGGTVQTEVSIQAGDTIQTEGTDQPDSAKHMRPGHFAAILDGEGSEAKLMVETPVFTGPDSRRLAFVALRKAVEGEIARLIEKAREKKASADRKNLPNPGPKAAAGKPSQSDATPAANHYGTRRSGRRARATDTTEQEQVHVTEVLEEEGTQQTAAQDPTPKRVVKKTRRVGFTAEVVGTPG